MSLALNLDRTLSTALYVQIAEQVKGQIASGRLPPGARLPTVRQLAEQLSITRLTAQNAYAELQSGGWVESTVGRGTFVTAASAGIRTQQQAAAQLAATGSALTTAGVIGDILQIGQTNGVRSLANASPDPNLFPADVFWRCLEAQRPDAYQVVGYGSVQGDPALRMALVDVLADRGIDAEPADILVTAGVTQALALVAQTLAQPGDVVLVEQPTYIGFLHQLRMFGLQPVAVPLDDDGPQVDVVERLAAQLRPRFFYTIPTYQNPTGLCQTLERRRQLVALARTHSFLLVEDDLYGALAYDTPPPVALKAIDPEVVVYISSLSKVLMPGLRLGYMVAPPGLQDRLTSLRLAHDLGSPLLLQRAAAGFLSDGGLRRHLRRTLSIYCERRNALVQGLQASLPSGVSITRPAGGFNCWVTLPRRGNLAELPRLMLQEGWAIAPGSVFLAQATAQTHVRLSFGSLPPEAIRQGVQILGRIVREQMSLPEIGFQEDGDWTPLV